MTATTLPQTTVETVDCLDCDGSGFTWIRRARDIEDLEQADCLSCGGHGAVPADHVASCTSCEGSFWADDGCQHEGLCEDCRPECDLCVLDRAEDEAYDIAREREVLAGGGWS